MTVQNTNSSTAEKKTTRGRTPKNVQKDVATSTADVQDEAVNQSETTGQADAIEPTDSSEATTATRQAEPAANLDNDIEKPAGPLVDTDEIIVVSLIRNVSYKDGKTGDVYEWDEIGHEEPMTYETIKNMWRNHKSYFKNMWLRPLDDRVINQLKLTSLYAKFDSLMDTSTYTRDTISTICDKIKNCPNGLKFAVIDKIKNAVVSEDISDVRIINSLQRALGIDLLSLI